jgi:leucyl aminopeptidase
MKFTALTENTIQKGTIVIPVLENETPQYPSPIDIPTSIFSGKYNTFYSISTYEGNAITLLVGLGKNPEYQEIKKVYRKITHQFYELLKEEVTLVFPDFCDQKFIEAAISGFVIGSYKLGAFKTDNQVSIEWDSKNIQVISALNAIEDILLEAYKIGQTQLEVMKMVDLPPNIVTPEYLALWCKKAGQDYGFQVKVLGKESAEKEQLHAFLAVNQGSSKEPQFIIAEYKGATTGPHLGLVGKGVTFDTGGLNIKTSSMEEMKSDMAGAAAVLGALQLIATLKLPIQVTAVVPCVENAVDNQSFLPSEVIQSYSGKSIEIVDTDAEGRLILADALSYLTKNYNTDYVIDLATLTGSCIGTFGYECAALFSNNEALIDSLSLVGKEIGEKVWPLPIWKAYAKEIESEVADVKNYHGKPFAGAIVAAKFLEYFTNAHPKWAHLDIAGTSFTSSEFYGIKHATAYGVQLLVYFAKQLITNHQK